MYEPKVALFGIIAQTRGTFTLYFPKQGNCESISRSGYDLSVFDGQHLDLPIVRYDLFGGKFRFPPTNKDYVTPFFRQEIEESVDTKGLLDWYRQEGVPVQTLRDTLSDADLADKR